MTTPETRMSKVRAVALAGTLLSLPGALDPSPANHSLHPRSQIVVSTVQEPAATASLSATPLLASLRAPLLPDPPLPIFFAPATARVLVHRGEPFTITAYAQRRRGRVVSTARTKTGVIPQVGRTVAVDPRVIPLGTRLQIDGIGERIAEDTGRAIKGRRIDLFVGSHEEGRRFGVRRDKKVRILAVASSGT